MGTEYCCDNCGKTFTHLRITKTEDGDCYNLPALWEVLVRCKDMPQSFNSGFVLADLCSDCRGKLEALLKKGF